MLRFVLRGGFSALFVLHLLAGFSQTGIPKTLLWRISGKGLQKPSYLFGTMHLQDKRLFQFGDSLYHALEQAEGFAMEINAAELVDSLMSSVVRDEEEKENKELAKQKIKLNRKKLDRSADSLLRSFGIKGNVASKKDLKRIRDYRKAQMLRQGEMPTIVDAYLLGMAMRMKKWTGGIEDVSDQLDLSDELGGELEPEAILTPESLFRKELEKMVTIYLAQDLDQIYAISNSGYSHTDRDLMLINRNIKMAYRMDSLARVRTMFFAVGAAHLPGDSGVIALLQKKGYNVEPVFSSSKIPADVYAGRLQQLAWIPVEGDNGAYSVQMPGKPTDYKSGNAMTMKMFFDITTMSFYFSGSASGSQIIPDMLDLTVKEMVRNISGKQAGVNTKPVQTGDLTGKEAIAENEDGSYRVRIFIKDQTIFFLLVGALKKANVNSADADRFFASFAPGNTTVQKKQWQTFSLPGKGFSVQLPGTPDISKELDKRVTEVDSSWKSISHQVYDNATNLYYLVQVREVKEGMYIEGDSAYFEMLKQDYATKIDKILKMQTATFQGYPAMYVDGTIKNINGVYKTIQIVRGNRVYMLLAAVPNGGDSTDAERFFQSFTLLPYAPAPYQVQQTDRFTSWAPSPFQLVPPDSSEEASQFAAHYLSYNPTDAVSYEVFVEGFSPFYWATNDSTFFQGKINQYKTETDSLLKKEWIQNGSVKGVDLIVQMPGYNSLRKVRLLVTADTLYTLFSMIPLQDIDKDYHKKFFSDFRLAKETPPTLYTPKTTQLLHALANGDSLTFQDAKDNLDVVEFSKEDLPALQQALLKIYQDNRTYYTVKDRLVNITSRLADSTTVSFIEKTYPSYKNDTASSQYALLAVLARMNTSQSYRLLKQIVSAQLPASGDWGMLHSALFDSLALTATLFPELLQHSNDSLFGRSTIVLANQLLDSNLLTLEKVMPYQDQLLKGAARAVALAKADKEKMWEFAEWADLLGRLNSSGGNAILRQALNMKDPYVKQSIILALLKNNHAVNAAEITKVAADKGQRGYFYEELQKLKKVDLFPAVYATQKNLAESELYNYLGEEYDDFTLTYLGERIENYEGKKKRFLLFKVRMNYEYEDRKQNFLAVAGPYELTAKEKQVSGEVTGIYVEEEFSPAKTGKLLKAYLETMKPAE